MEERFRKTRSPLVTQYFPSDTHLISLGATALIKRPAPKPAASISDLKQGSPVSKGPSYLSLHHCSTFQPVSRELGTKASPGSGRGAPEGPADAPRAAGRAQTVTQGLTQLRFPCPRGKQPLGPAEAFPRPAVGSGGPAGARHGSAAGADTDTALASGTAGPPRPPPRSAMPGPQPPARPRGAHKGPRGGHPARRPLAYRRPRGGWLPSVGARSTERGSGSGSPGSRQRRYERSGGGGGTGPACACSDGGGEGAGAGAAVGFEGG